MTDTIGTNITLTTTRTLYWTIITDGAVNGTAKIAIIDAMTEPDPTTVWHDTAWVSPDEMYTLHGKERHRRRCSLLVAGPDGPTAGSPVVLPAGGEYGTWVRVDTTNERVEVPAQLLVVG